MAVLLLKLAVLHRLKPGLVPVKGPTCFQTCLGTAASTFSKATRVSLRVLLASVELPAGLPTDMAREASSLLPRCGMEG